MRKTIALTVSALLVTMGVGAQNIYDAVKFGQNELNGTARYVGMGGAMGALGGDISTISTNPAGIGIYRSNDAMTTISFSALETKSNFTGISMKEDKNRFNFDNVGFVISNKIGDYTALRYVNFAFNYKRNKSLNKLMSMQGLIPQVPGDGGKMYNISQTTQMANQANQMYHGSGHDIMDYEGNPYRETFGWLTALGWHGGLYMFDEDKQMYTGYLDQPYAQFYSKETGGIDEYTLNTSFNFNDRIYLGLTLGLYDVNYKKYSMYDEAYGDHWGYTLHSWNKTDGSGFDVKVGAIFRPFESSPLRIGVAVHTPTFYTLTNKTEAHLAFDGMEDGQGGYVDGDIKTYDELGGRTMSTKYRLHTPWKYNFSLGYTVGSALALGAEYEYQDFSTMKFRYTDYGGGSMGWETGTAKDMLKGVSTIRLGAEYKFLPEFAFRAGYNLSTSAFKSSAFKELPENSVITDTDYANTKSISDYTFGFGYRGKSFYADLAYRFHTYKENFYAFYDADIYNGNYTNDLEKTSVTNNKHQVMLTLGVRF